MFKVAKKTDLTLNEGWAYEKGGGAVKGMVSGITAIVFY
jgi:hypothetical protein